MSSVGFLIFDGPWRERESADLCAPRRAEPRKNAQLFGATPFSQRYLLSIGLDGLDEVNAFLVFTSQPSADGLHSSFASGPPLVGCLPEATEEFQRAGIELRS